MYIVFSSARSRFKRVQYAGGCRDRMPASLRPFVACHWFSLQTESLKALLWPSSKASKSFSPEGSIIVAFSRRVGKAWMGQASMVHQCRSSQSCGTDRHDMVFVYHFSKDAVAWTNGIMHGFTASCCCVFRNASINYIVSPAVNFAAAWPVDTTSNGMYWIFVASKWKKEHFIWANFHE